MEEITRLLPVVELFKKSFDLYFKKVWTYAGLMLFGFIGALVFLPFGLIGFLISYQPFSHNDFNITIILVDVLFGLISFLIFIIFSLWAKVSLYCAVKDTGLKFKESLGAGWLKIASFFWISLLVGLATLGGLLLVIIPGIIFAVWFIFSVYVYIDEGTKAAA